MIQYTRAETPQDLWQILELQSKNLPHCVEDADKKTQGFVTVQHEIELLRDMNSKYQHIIAKDNDTVIGFALVMLKDFADKIPILVPMFALLDQLTFKDKPLQKMSYFVMGQICIDQAYRGKGVFKGLYHALRTQMQGHFEVVVTEIATRNQRSQNAHAAQGFKPLERYQAGGEEWEIVVWDWQ